MAEINDEIINHKIRLPSETIPYVQFDTGIDFGTSYLTENIAFIIGGMFASDESVTNNGIKYQISPFRYNYSFATNVEIIEHYDKIKKIIKPFDNNAQIIMADNIRGTGLDSGKNRMPGFSVFVPTINRSLDSLIPGLKKALLQSRKSVKRSFYAGIFDGRGSIDRNKSNNSIRYISVDCPNPDLGEFLYDILTENGIPCNYNTARDRLEGGNPRNNQLRIKSADQFSKEIGFVSPKKNNIIVASFKSTGRKYNVYLEKNALPGLITIDVQE